MALKLQAHYSAPKTLSIHKVFSHTYLFQFADHEGSVIERTNLLVTSTVHNGHRLGNDNITAVAMERL